MHEKEAVKVARDLTSVLNRMGGTKGQAAFVDEICNRTHRTLQQNVMGLIVMLIKQWAELDKDGFYDLRNEATVKLATKILSKLDEEDLVMPFI